MISERSDLRRKAHKELDGLLDQFEMAEDLEPVSRQITGMLLLAQAARLAGSLVGAKTMSAVNGAADATDRVKGLNLLSSRMDVASYLFPTGNVTDRFSMSAAAKEIEAIALGDKPQLFRQLASTKTPARLAMCRLRALEWDAFLDSFGCAPARRKLAITDAFGTDWETIRKWKALVSKDLQPGSVRLAIADAKRAGSLAKSGQSMITPRWLTLTGRVGEWEDELVCDGRAFLEEQRAGKAAL